VYDSLNTLLISKDAEDIALLLEYRTAFDEISGRVITYIITTLSISNCNSW
jgi:hypothetical protein